MNDTLLTVLAITSLIVSLFPNFINACTLLSYFLAPSWQRNGLKVGYMVFGWLALFVWPIVYFFVR